MHSHYEIYLPLSIMGSFLEYYDVIFFTQINAYKTLLFNVIIHNLPFL